MALIAVSAAWARLGVAHGIEASATAFSASTTAASTRHRWWQWRSQRTRPQLRVRRDDSTGYHGVVDDDLFDSFGTSRRSPARKLPFATSLEEEGPA